MPKQTITLEFTKRELQEILCEKYKIKIQGSSFNLRVTQGSSRDAGSTHISLSGEKESHERNHKCDDETSGAPT